MEVLLAIGTIQCLFLILILLSKKPLDFADQILVALLIFWALRFATYWAVLNDLHDSIPRLIGIEQTLYLLDGPILYLYILALIKELPHYSFKYTRHFLPFLAVLIYTFVKFLQYTDQEIINLFVARLELLRQQESIDLFWDEQLFILGVCLSLLTYTLLSHQAIGRFQAKMSTPPSESDTKMWSWLKTSMLCWVGLFVLPFIFFLINYMTNWLPVYLTDLPLVYAFLVLIFVPAYQGLKFSQSSATPTEENSQENKTLENLPTRYQKSGLKEEQAQAYQNKLQDFMSKEKPFLDPDLNLSSLAEALNMSSNHLSQTINERLGQTFYDFINQYRVEEVKKKLADPNFKAYTLLGIAEESGFKSKSSFNNTFKRLVGMPPSEYKKQLNKSDSSPS